MHKVLSSIFRPVMVHTRFLSIVLLGFLSVAAIGGCARHRANSPTLDERLLLAAKKDDTAAVQHLLQKGARLDAKDEGGSTALALAAEFGHADTARFLMSKGADKIAAGLEGDEALISGAQSGYATKVGILLARGTSAKAKNEALLALAGKSLPAIIASAVDVQHSLTSSAFFQVHYSEVSRQRDTDHRTVNHGPR